MVVQWCHFEHSPACAGLSLGVFEISRLDYYGKVLYEKYSRRDVCQLLNCEKDLSSIMYGMKVIDNDACIFVTYNKEEAEDGKNYVDGKPDYADEFIDRQTFAWDSKIGQGIGSKYVKSIEASENIRLFIKKSDGEGVDFYYMGKAKITVICNW